jgi:hypothetical protein
MQRGQESPESVAKLFMAGLLAVLLLGFGGFAAAGSLHHAAQHDHAADAGACVICSLAHGQIDLADNAPLVAATLFLPLCGLLAASAGVPWSYDFLLPPGRGPPGLSHSL